MLVFRFLTLEQHTTFKESMINRLSNLINRNRSEAKLSQVFALVDTPQTVMPNRAPAVLTNLHLLLPQLLVQLLLQRKVQQSEK